MEEGAREAEGELIETAFLEEVAAAAFAEAFWSPPPRLRCKALVFVGCCFACCCCCRWGGGGAAQSISACSSAKLSRALRHEDLNNSSKSGRGGAGVGVGQRRQKRRVGRNTVSTGNKHYDATTPTTSATNRDHKQCTATKKSSRPHTANLD